jgi:hypothetical protein
VNPVVDIISPITVTLWAISSSCYLSIFLTALLRAYGGSKNPVPTRFSFSSNFFFIFFAKLNIFNII